MNTTISPPAVACDACGGPQEYRVTITGNPNPDDNFDQIADHPSPFFTSPVYLEFTASSSAATITVRHYPGGWTPDADGTIVAFAGVGPETGYRTWFVVNPATSTAVPA